MKRALIPAAKLALCRKWPYAATAIMSVAATPKPGIGTAAIDKHFRLYYDPDFLQDLHSKEGFDAVVGLLAHEVAHPMLRHFKRAQRIKDAADSQWQMRWNVATDCSINSMLKAEGITLPSCAVFPADMGFPDELSAEEYYALLLDKAEEQDQGEPSGDGGQSGEGDGQASGEPGEGQADGDGEPQEGDMPGGSGADGEPRSWEGQKPSDGDNGQEGGLTEAEVEQVARKCAEEAKSRGTGSGGFGREADGVLEPKIDPRRLLMRAVTKRLTGASSGGGISSYRRPSRRQPIGNVLRPRTVSPSPKVVVIVDTSGSMNDRELAECLGLIAKTLRVVGTSGVQVVAGDTKVCSDTQAFHPNQVGKLNLAGGGGTDMANIINAVANAKQPPDLIICATDGGTGWPTERLKMPVVVCLTSRGSIWQTPPEWMDVVSMH